MPTMAMSVSATPGKSSFVITPSLRPQTWFHATAASPRLRPTRGFYRKSGKGDTLRRPHIADHVAGGDNATLMPHCCHDWPGNKARTAYQRPAPCPAVHADLRATVNNRIEAETHQRNRKARKPCPSQPFEKEMKRHIAEGRAGQARGQNSARSAVPSHASGRSSAARSSAGKAPQMGEKRRVDGEPITMRS